MRQLSFGVVALSCLGLFACVDPTTSLPDGSVEVDGGGMQIGTDGGGGDGGGTAMDGGLDDGGVVVTDDGGVVVPDGGVVPTDGGGVVAVDATFTVDEDGTATGQLSATTDAGTSLTFALNQAATNGAATVSSTGVFTYAPSANFFGTDTFTFRVSDGASLAVGTVTATVTAINDAPVITGQGSVTTLEDTARTLALADLTVTDVDDAFPTGFALQAAAGANYTLAGAVLTPAADFAGTLTVPVTVTDAAGANSASFSLSVVVTGVDDAPVLTGQGAITTAEDTARTLTAADLTITDVDSSSFIVSLSAGANYTINGATLTPAADFTGTLWVPVTVSDGTSASNTLTVSVTVSPVNDAPVITAQRALSTVEETGLGLSAADLTITDPDSSTFTLTIAPGSNYTVSGNSVVPATNFAGVLSVPVTVSDGSATSSAFTLSITVTNVNDAPVITAQNTVNTAEDTARTLTLADLQVSDPDDAYPTGFTLQVSAGANYTLSGAVLTPAANFVGTLSVPVTVRDAANAGSNTFLLSVTVSAVDDAPLITGQNTVTTAEDTSRTLSPADLTITDVDSSTFTLAVSGGANYTVSGTTVTPAANYSGLLSVPVTVSDGTNTSNSFTLSVTVTAVNDAPVITGQGAVITAEDTARGLTVADLTITDVDSSAFTLTVLPGTNYTVSGTTVTPAANFNGTLTVGVTVTDGSAPSNTFALSLTVTPVDDPPVITGQNSLTTAEDTARTITLADLIFTDPDSSSFTLSFSSPTNCSVVGATLTPAPNFVGNASVVVTLSDGFGTSNAFGITIAVTSVDDVPFLTGQNTISTAEDTARTVTATDLLITDPDSSAFTVTLTAGTNYTVSGATLTPALDFNGTLSVPVRVSDGTSNSNTLTLTVTVTAVNDAPVAAADTYSTNGNTLLTVAARGVLANDTDVESAASTLTVTGFSAVSANNGSVSVAANGSFTYLPPVGAVNATDTFTYTVSDPNGATKVGTVTVSTVTPRVWYVNGSGANGDGRSSSPFNNLASAISASFAGDPLFLYAGSYTGPAVLKANQRLVGHPAGLSLPTSNFTIAPGARPSITLPSATAAVVQLASGAEVTQVSVGVPNGVTFSATSTTGGLVDNVVLSAGAVGFQLQAATGLTLQNVTSNGLLDSVLRVPDGSYVSGLTLKDSTFTNVGNAVGDRAFNFGSGFLTGTGPVQGTVLLQRLTVSATGQDGIFLEAAGNTGTLDLDAVTLSAPNNGGMGLLVRADAVNASPPTLSVTVRNGSVIEVGNGGDAMNFAAEGSAASNLTVLVTNATLRAATGTVPDDGLRATADGLNSRLNLRVVNTAITNFNGRGIAVASSAAGALLQAVVDAVSIIANGASTPLSSGFLAETITSTSSGSLRASVRNSAIDVLGGPAIMTRARAGAASRLDLELLNNAPLAALSPVLPAVDLASQGSALGCLAMSANTASSSSGTAYQLNEVSPSTLQLEGTGASATAQLSATNFGGGVSVNAGVGLVSPGTCIRPTN